MPKSTIKTHSIIILLVMAVAFTGVYASILDKKIDLNGDNGNYYMLGKALATGQGYVNINSFQKHLHKHFPPGYPLLISSIIRVKALFLKK